MHFCPHKKWLGLKAKEYLHIVINEKPYFSSYKTLFEKKICTDQFAPKKHFACRYTWNNKCKLYTGKETHVGINANCSLVFINVKVMFPTSRMSLKANDNTDRHDKQGVHWSPYNTGNQNKIQTAYYVQRRYLYSAT